MPDNDFIADGSITVLRTQEHTAKQRAECANTDCKVEIIIIYAMGVFWKNLRLPAAIPHIDQGICQHTSHA